MKKIHFSVLYSDRSIGNRDLPLTAKGQVNLIVTEMAVIKVNENGLLLTEMLTEIAVDTTVEQVIKVTGAELKVASDLKTFGEIE